MATTMGSLLESLASHYEQMYTALKETEDGEPFGEEDLLRTIFLFGTKKYFLSLALYQKCTEMLKNSLLFCLKWSRAAKTSTVTGACFAVLIILTSDTFSVTLFLLCRNRSLVILFA